MPKLPRGQRQGAQGFFRVKLQRPPLKRLQSKRRRNHFANHNPDQRLPPPAARQTAPPARAPSAPTHANKTTRRAHRRHKPNADKQIAGDHHRQQREQPSGKARRAKARPAAFPPAPKPAAKATTATAQPPKPRSDKPPEAKCGKCPLRANPQSKNGSACNARHGGATGRDFCRTENRKPKSIRRRKRRPAAAKSDKEKGGITDAQRRQPVSHQHVGDKIRRRTG